MNYSQCSIRDWDEENSVFPRWELVLTDRNHLHYPSQCILRLEWSTRDDGKWGRRSAQHQTIRLDFSGQEIEILILAAAGLPETYPDECLGDTQVHTHGGYSPTRSNTSSVICRSISFVTDGRYAKGFYVRKDSLVWSDSAWGMEIMKRVFPHLMEAPWRISKQKHKLP